MAKYNAVYTLLWKRGEDGFFRGNRSLTQSGHHPWVGLDMQKKNVHRPPQARLLLTHKGDSETKR